MLNLTTVCSASLQSKTHDSFCSSALIICVSISFSFNNCPKAIQTLCIHFVQVEDMNSVNPFCRVFIIFLFNTSHDYCCLQLSLTFFSQKHSVDFLNRKGVFLEVVTIIWRIHISCVPFRYRLPKEKSCKISACVET